MMSLNALLKQKLDFEKRSDPYRARILKVGNQKSTQAFSDLFKNDNSMEIKFLDSGSYGSVFISTCTKTSRETILKLVLCAPDTTKKTIFEPKKAEHSDLVCSTYADAFNEVKSLQCLSYLTKGLSSKDKFYMSKIFPEIYNIKLVHGEIPEHFQLEPCKASLPEIIKSSWSAKYFDKGIPAFDSVFYNVINTNEKIVIDMEPAGERIDNILDKLSPEVYLSIFKQLCLGLMVAETVLMFEHRDLHFGNLLVKETKEKIHSVVHRNALYTFDSCNVALKLVDTTFSFLKFHNQTYSKNLSNLFSKRDIDKLDYNDWDCSGMDATYNQMACEVKLTNWCEHHPRTNLIWIKYIGSKFLRQKCFKKAQTEKDILVRDWFESFLREIPKMKNCRQLVKTMIKNFNQTLPISKVVYKQS